MGADHAEERKAQTLRRRQNVGALAPQARKPAGRWSRGSVVGAAWRLSHHLRDLRRRADRSDPPRASPQRRVPAALMARHCTTVRAPCAKRCETVWGV